MGGFGWACSGDAFPEGHPGGDDELVADAGRVDTTGPAVAAGPAVSLSGATGELSSSLIAGVQADAAADYDFTVRPASAQQSASAHTDHLRGFDALSVDAGGATVAVAGISMGLSVGRATIVENATVNVAKNRVAIDHPHIQEWFVNGPLGVEHGFTLKRPSTTPVRLRVRVDGDLTAQQLSDQSGIGLRDSDDIIQATYTQLHAQDSRGRPLPAHMHVDQRHADGQTIVIEVDDARAVYPVTVDPLLARPRKLAGSQAAGGDRVGFEVAIAGDTAVVARHGNPGLAYVYRYDGSTWARTQTLTPSTGQTDGVFGTCVDIDGSTIIVGATRFGYQGRVYVFRRQADQWTPSQILGAGQGAGHKQFGADCDLDGDQMAVGEAATNTSSGAVYVFDDLGDAWGHRQMVELTEAGADSRAGASVAISGDRFVVGAPDASSAQTQPGAAFVFEQSAEAWTKVATLRPTGLDDGADFGASVAIDGAKAVVGAPGQAQTSGGLRGRAFVFNAANGWSQVASLAADSTDPDWGGLAFGSSVAIDDTTIAVGAPVDPDAYYYDGRGAAFVFERTPAGWQRAGKVHPAADGRKINFAESVDLAGQRLIAGTPDANTRGVHSGGAFIYRHDTGSWDGASRQAHLIAPRSHPTSSFMGDIDLDDATLVIGQIGASDTATDEGAAYVFGYDGTRWQFQQRFRSTSPQGYAEFGSALAVSGERIAVGAPRFDDGSDDEVGRVHIYRRGPNGWNLEQTLIGPGSDRGHFGAALALDETRLAVGAPDDDVADSPFGSVYVYDFDGTSWAQPSRIDSPDTVDHGPFNYTDFGGSVDVRGGRLLVGDPGNDSGQTNAGKAYLYEYASGAWTGQALAAPSTTGEGARFGARLVLGDTSAVVGAPSTTVGGVNSAGMVFVYSLDGPAPVETDALAADTPESGGNFGADVALRQPSLLVGSSSCRAYLFSSASGPWLPTQSIEGPDCPAFFGRGVALGADQASILGVVPGVLSGQNFAGDSPAYVYDFVDAITANPASITVPEDEPFGTDLPLSGVSPSGANLTYQITAGPSHGSISGITYLQYTPDDDYSGTDMVAYTASDGPNTSLPAQIDITVVPENDNPEGIDQNVETEVDTPVDVSLSGSDVDGDVLTYAISSPPSDGSLSGTPPELTYTPASGFVGTDTFEFIVDDGRVAAGAATVAIEVSSVPQAQNQQVSVNEDESISITLVGSDADDDDATLTYRIVRPPAHGTLAGYAYDRSYTPAADFNGADSFDYVVEDLSHTSDVATIDVTVNPVDDAPRFVEPTPQDTVDATVGQPFEADIAIEDIDSDTVTISATDLPETMQFDADNRQLSWTPTVADIGSHRVELRADDGQLSADHQFSVDVQRDCTLSAQDSDTDDDGIPDRCDADDDADSVDDDADRCPKTPAETSDGCPADNDPDAGVDVDAGTVDAGTVDAGASDAGASDAGASDAGASDAGAALDTDIDDPGSMTDASDLHDDAGDQDVGRSDGSANHDPVELAPPNDPADGCSCTESSPSQAASPFCMMLFGLILIRWPFRRRPGRRSA